MLTSSLEGAGKHDENGQIKPNFGYGGDWKSY